jgi:hypothetical protein
VCALPNHDDSALHPGQNLNNRFSVHKYLKILKRESFEINSQRATLNRRGLDVFDWRQVLYPLAEKWTQHYRLGTFTINASYCDLVNSLHLSSGM